MKDKGYVKSEELYFSALYGDGVYKDTGVMVPDPLSSDASGRSPLLENVFTGEKVFFRRLHLSDPDLWDSYANRVLEPPDRNVIFWPVDILDVPGGRPNGGTVFVDHEYAPRDTPAAEREGELAAVFRHAGFRRAVDGFKKLEELGGGSWKDQAVRDIAVQLAGAIDALNRDGVIYNDFHLSRLFFLDGQRLYLDYSNMANTRWEFARRDAEAVLAADEGRYPIEFADPAVVQGIVPFADYQSQNYSLCALLFYLFFGGQYAYDGRLMTGYVDDNRENHYIKFRDYHKMPVFVFDPDDDSNSLFVFDNEEETIELWEEAPELLKEMFTRTLCEKNALRRSAYVDNPSGAKWLQCFRKLGWMTPDGEGTNR